ncbi:MAG: hypothetical protein H7144_17975 [Burkholderiales bacterium]|nr:hypothetical protein [Phycisphaerae bacterium]
MRNSHCILAIAATAAIGLGTLTIAQDKSMESGRPELSKMEKPMGAMAKIDKGMAEKMVASWPEASKMACMAMMEKYGPPNEMTPTHAMWMNNGPWKWTCVSSMATEHKFPVAHEDVMEQAIDYRVPPEMVSKIVMYDGSVTVKRTEGLLTARCDKEGANFLALNLAHEIATGKRSVEEARMEYAKQIDMVMKKQPAPLTEKLMFAPMKDKANDTDQPAMMK